MLESHKSANPCHLAPWEYDLYMLSRYYRALLTSNLLYSTATKVLDTMSFMPNRIREKNFQLSFLQN